MGHVLVWVLILFLVVDALTGLVHPLDKVPFVQMSQAQWAQRSLNYKLSQFVSEKSDPDVLVLGSSLPMSMIYWADSRKFNQDSYAWTIYCCQKNLSPVMAYPHARYFESRLGALAGKSANVENLTSPGCMASDSLVTLLRALSSKKKPGIVLIAIAPRDFIDNLAQPIGRTLQYSSLINLPSMADVLPHLASLDAAVELFLDSVSNVYRERNNFRTAIKAWSEKSVSRLRERLGGNAPQESAAIGSSGQSADASVSNQQVNCQQGECTGRPLSQTLLSRFPSMTAAMREDLTVYNARYNPPNFSRLANEIACFESVLRKCRHEGIPVIVFNMPISDENRSLIAPSIYDLYKANTKRLSCELNARYVDLDRMGLKACDFSDSVHLRESSAPGVIDAMVASMTNGQLKTGCSHPQSGLWFQ